MHYPVAPEITKPSGYLNTGGQPVRIADYRGKKVVLVDFWTYSCINCMRTTPYLNAWYDKYKDQGLEIVGVHTPEFAFEHVIDNVAKAIAEEGIKYPVVLDNDYATWNAFKNQYWPRKYLVDIDGYIVYDHAGEGDYDVTEQEIQKALEERSRVLRENEAVAGGIVAPPDVTAIDFGRVGSPESYFGSARNQYLGNGTPGASGSHTFSAPQSPSLNRLYLAGTWDIAEESAQSKSAGSIIYRYSAKNVYLVMSSHKGNTVTILLDGKPVGLQGGEDVREDGTVFVQENRLYKLVGGSDYAEHTLEIKVDGPGLEAYAFTFG
jgi:thiol-disulfide isomerase/thioredoxin